MFADAREAEAMKPRAVVRALALWLCLLVVAGALLSVPASVGHADVPSSCHAIADGMVLDTKTMLMWQQSVDPGSYAWADAQAYCAMLAPGGGVWRLPSMKELMSIVDVTRADPAIDPVAFPATPSDYFWSSSPQAGSSTAVWGVNFNKGSAGVAPLDFTARVRCVRP